MSWFSNYCENVKKHYKENTWMTREAQTGDMGALACDESAGWSYMVGAIAACIEALFD